MTERLDRIESNLLATTERLNETQAVLNQTAQQQAVNTSEIDTLLGAVSTNEVAVRSLAQTADRVLAEIAESNQCFEVLRSDAIADRQASDQHFEAMQAEATADRQTSDQRFEVLRSDAIADRQASDQRFAAMQAEATADRQTSDQRFEESNRRFDAQLAEIRAQGEQIRALLSALATTNGRVDALEQAS